MSGKLTISLVMLLGVAITLSACNDISVKPNYPGGNSSSSTLQETPSSASPSPARQPSQTLSQNNLKGKIAAASIQAERENYKPISVAEMADTAAVVGNDPKEIALSAFGNIESEGGIRDVKVDYPQPNQAVVTITQTGVADDSVGGIRYRVELRQNKEVPTGRQWEIVWAGSQVKCHQGRGHQDWSMELCL